MNAKQKVLTIVALVVFGAVIFAHYHGGFVYYLNPLEIHLQDRPLIPDVRMPLFVLAVFYTGLLFLLATPRAKGPKS